MDRALDIQTLISAVEAKKGETCSMSKLKEFAPMLKDYFSIGIEQDENGKWVLRALPLLISDYEPFYGYLPLFLFNLCTQVHYTNEKLWSSGAIQLLASTDRLYRVFERCFGVCTIKPSNLKPDFCPFKITSKQNCMDATDQL